MMVVGAAAVLRCCTALPITSHAQEGGFVAEHLATLRATRPSHLSFLRCRVPTDMDLQGSEVG
jgi:hypothetical protein